MYHVIIIHHNSSRRVIEGARVDTLRNRVYPSVALFHKTRYTNAFNAPRLKQVSIVRPPYLSTFEHPAQPIQVGNPGMYTRGRKCKMIRRWALLITVAL